MNVSIGVDVLERLVDQVHTYLDEYGGDDSAYQTALQTIKDTKRENSSNRDLARAILSDLENRLTDEMSKIRAEQIESFSDRKIDLLTAKMNGLKKSVEIIQTYRRDVIDVAYPTR
jgi:hypothetical protein